MLQFFLNPWMLAGLAGITLPIIVHLLVRRRYHVVDWGAMQFLSPGLRTRRRLQLQDVALLLLRIAVVAILAMALARPWFYGGLFSGYHSDGSRDVVLVIDGSASMAQPDGITTLHQSAIRRAATFLDSLSASDTVMLIDARDLPDVRLQPPETNRQVIREQLNQLDPPGGYSNLPGACERAASLLLQTSGRHREIIVFTDAQRASWKLDTPDVWQQFDDLLELAAVRPRLWIVDTSRNAGPNQNLISVGRLTIQPESTVPDGEVRVTALVKNHSSTPLDVPLRLMADGQPVGPLRRLQIAALQEAGTEFVHRVSGTGVQELRIEAELPDDVLQVDNRSSAVAVTRDAPRVLLVESSGDSDITRQRSWFAAAALTPPADTPPWVLPQTVPLDQLSEDDIRSADVIILPDVGELPGNSTEWLRTAVDSGTGLLVAVGSHTSAGSFHRSFVRSGLLPNVQLTEPAVADEPIRVLPSSLLTDWLEPFRNRPNSSFLNAVFSSWWTIDLVGPNDPQDRDEPAASAHTVARLSNQAPLLLECRQGRGRVILLTTPLDTTWSNLPGRPDFVAFLYEAVFHLAPAPESRNQLPGQQLVATLDDSSHTNLSIEPPSGTRVPVQSSLVSGVAKNSAELRVRYDRTFVPGIYRLLSSDSGGRLDAFAVDYHRDEDSTDDLAEDDRRLLSESERMVFTDSVTRLQQTMYGQESVTELWWLLVLVCLLLLVLESWSTRRLVIQRYGAQNDAPEDTDPPQP